MEILVQALSRIMNVEGKVQIQNIGTRHGEKLYESLLGTEESVKAIDQGGYFRVPLDARSLDYQIYFEKGQESANEGQSYNSHNTVQLDVNQVVDLIQDLPEFQAYMRANQ